MLLKPLCSTVWLVDAAAKRLEGLTQSVWFMRAWAPYIKAPTQRRVGISFVPFYFGHTLGYSGQRRRAERTRVATHSVSCTHTGAATRHRRTAMHHRASNISAVGVLRTRQRSSGEVTLCSRRRDALAACSNPQKVQLLRRCVGVQKFCADWKRFGCELQLGQRDTQNIHGNAAAAPAAAVAHPHSGLGLGQSRRANKISDYACKQFGW